MLISETFSEILDLDLLSEKTIGLPKKVEKLYVRFISLFLKLIFYKYFFLSIPIRY